MMFVDSVVVYVAHSSLVFLCPCVAFFDQIFLLLSLLFFFFIFLFFFFCVVFFQAEDGIRDLVRSRGLGDVYKRQV